MTLQQAKDSIAGGAKFGAVFPMLATEEDRAELREWFVRTPTVPAVTTQTRPVSANGTPRTGTAMLAASQARRRTPTGNPCPVCQGTNLVRTGTCVTCLDCSHNEGCG